MKEWEEGRARAIQNREKDYLGRQDTDGQPTPLGLRVDLENRFEVGLFRWWEGKEEEARGLFAEAAQYAQRLMERILPGCSGRDAPDWAARPQDGAIAAALSGQQELARTLFAHAARLASGLVTGQEEEPAEPTSVLHPYSNSLLIQAYSLIRLGKLSGFHALLYPVPFPEARHAQPVWKQTDIHSLLEAAETFRMVVSAQRIPDSHNKKVIIPLLKALAACLDGKDVEESREAARKALKTCYDRIRDLVDFCDLYPLALDLELAFPHVFEP
jgi:hypothetical protein